MIRGLLGGLLLVGVLNPLAGEAYRLTERGNRLFEEGDLDGALGAYTEAQVHAPESPELYYNIGNVLYEKGDYAGAAETYRRALGGASQELRGDAAYNLGNALFRQQQFEDAAAEYRRALEAAHDDADAKRNLELALRELERRQQQQQQQQRQDQQQQQQRQDQQQQQQPDPRDQQPQQQQQGGKDEEDEERASQPQQDQQQQDQQQQQQEQPSGAPELDREQAEKLLDTLAEQERDNLRKEAVRKGRGRARDPEKDW